MKTWQELYPNGKFIFYEGDTPEAFADEIKEKFGFDPRDSGCWNEEGDFGFHCPGKYMDDIMWVDNP